MKTKMVKKAKRAPHKIEIGSWCEKHGIWRHQCSCECSSLIHYCDATYIRVSKRRLAKSGARS